MEAIDKLVDGFHKFKQQYYIEEPSLFEELVDKGQSPKTLIIACCDSRVHPAQVLNTSPGDIFVARNVANLVPPFEDDGKPHGTSAAIEYGVKHLKVEHIIVFGHGQCGGIKSLMSGGVGVEDDDFINSWMQVAMPTCKEILASHADKPFVEQCHICEQVLIEVSVYNLLSFPWVKSRVDAGELKVHGWYFEMEQGMLFYLNKEDGSFSLFR